MSKVKTYVALKRMVPDIQKKKPPMTFIDFVVVERPRQKIRFLKTFE